MDKLKAMAAFVRIVDAGSLTAAADALDVSQPSMVRRLATLEAALGVRLINRTTRRMALTDEGREYYERCKRVLAAVDEAEASLSARRAEPRGRLRLTSSVTFGRALLAPLVVDFMVAHPQLRVEAMLLDRVIDLIEEGVDVGVRLAHLPDSSLVAVPVGETRRIVVGSPALIRRQRVVHLHDLRAAPCVRLALYWPAPTPIHVVYPQARLLSGNIRSFVDFVVPRLRSRVAALRG